MAKQSTDACRFCGAADLFDNWFDREGYAVSNGGAGTKYRTICNACGQFQDKPFTLSAIRERDLRKVQRGRSKRGYSTDFTPHGNSGKRYLLDCIPAGLWTRARAQAKREGVSMRALLLQLLTDWLEASEKEVSDATR